MFGRCVSWAAPAFDIDQLHVSLLSPPFPRGQLVSWRAPGVFRRNVNGAATIHLSTSAHRPVLPSLYFSMMEFLPNPVVLVLISGLIRDVLKPATHKDKPVPVEGGCISAAQFWFVVITGHWQTTPEAKSGCAFCTFLCTCAGPGLLVFCHEPVSLATRSAVELQPFPSPILPRPHYVLLLSQFHNNPLAALNFE